MDNLSEIKDGKIAVFLDSRVYKIESILKCLYWYSSKFNTDVVIVDEKNQFKVTILPNLEYLNISLEVTLEKLV